MKKERLPEGAANLKIEQEIVSSRKGRW